MSINEFIALYAYKSGCTQKDTRYMLEKFWESIEFVLTQDESINFLGIGTFKNKHYGEREMFDLSTGKMEKKKKTSIPAFKASPTWKKKIEDARNEANPFYYEEDDDEDGGDT